MSTVPRSGDLRLVQNGYSSSSKVRGRLEVYFNGQWGTVCDIGWSSENTRVVCRQLGLPTARTNWTTSSAGGGDNCTLQNIKLIPGYGLHYVNHRRRKQFHFGEAEHNIHCDMAICAACMNINKVSRVKYWGGGGGP